MTPLPWWLPPPTPLFFKFPNQPSSNNNDKAGSRAGGQCKFFFLTRSFRLKAKGHKSSCVIAVPQLRATWKGGSHPLCPCPPGAPPHPQQGRVPRAWGGVGKGAGAAWWSLSLLPSSALQGPQRAAGRRPTATLAASRPLTLRGCFRFWQSFSVSTVSADSYKDFGKDEASSRWREGAGAAGQGNGLSSQVQAGKQAAGAGLGQSWVPGLLAPQSRPSHPGGLRPQATTSGALPSGALTQRTRSCKTQERSTFLPPKIRQRRQRKRVRPAPGPAPGVAHLPAAHGGSRIPALTWPAPLPLGHSCEAPTPPSPLCQPCCPLSPP